ncbi:hypothetical protein [Cecembia lonarensis]|uniref:Uncharacterized protein n=1 Tax=Cecembia lonarensis (strain CCUG 58316 / KCTC 22772 / LW9) TaxID=1225176 RepID=K1LBR2_CECL9|nr:hypothetical protein [Cecembia lonarensis]EKB49677.1 hypothetical protein B879_01694 [Cecembia lonarensis LW9]
MIQKTGFLFLLLFSFFLGLETAYAQKFILLQRGENQKTRLKFEIGENFTYKTKSVDFFVTDRIVDITPAAIILTENVLLPSDITAVEIIDKDPRNITISNFSYLGMGAGVLFLVGTTVNSLYQQGDLSEVGNTIGWPIGLFATGFLISKMKYKTFKHKGKNKIQLVILYED